MEIIHPSGEAYDLLADSALKITRTNPFFSDIGEQSIPVSIPMTSKNNRLLGYPSRADQRQRIKREIDVILRDGVYQQPCRQKIFGIDDTALDTAFYLNAGDFYTRIKEVMLHQVFEGEVWDYAGRYDILWAIGEAYAGRDEAMSIFPVAVDDPDKEGAYKILNRINRSFPGQGLKPFYNEESRIETRGEGEDQVEVTLPEYYYMTPFLKVNYLLKRIFQFIGYTLNPNFFTQTEEFRSMVLLNNTADAMVTGKIYPVDLLPSAAVNDFLNVLRNRFRCEFIANPDRTVDIILMADILKRKPTVDLSATIAGSAIKRTYAELQKLKIEQTSTVEQKEKILKNLSALIKENTAIHIVGGSYPIGINYVLSGYEPQSGVFFRNGVSGCSLVRTIIAYADQIVVDTVKDELSENVLTLSDKIPDDVEIDNYTYPYIGAYRCVRSVVTTTTGGENNTEEMIDSDLDFMLCFWCGDADAFKVNGIVVPATWRYGSVITGPEVTPDFYEPAAQRTYSLHTYGDIGIYNKFHRSYDRLMRNALDTVESEHDFTEIQKLTLSPVEPVMINNQIYLPETMEYAIGSKEQISCTWKSLACAEPVAETFILEDILPKSDYYWVMMTDHTETPFFKWEYLDGIPSVNYYEPPTAEQFASGGRFHVQKFECQGWAMISGGSAIAFNITTWLEPRKF